MNVTLLKPYGLCPGASKAIKIIKSTRNSNPEANIYLFGPIVHNENFNELMEKLKINVLDLPYEEYFDVIKTLEPTDIVILAAHGHEQALETRLLDNGILFIDTTCPIINKLHSKILNEYLDKEIIYIGKKSHIESITTCMLKEDIYLYDLKDKMDFSIIESENPIVLNQTTLSKYDIKNALDDIKEHFPNAIIANTLCHQCTNRQNMLLNSTDDNSFVFVVGSKTSSNTNSLLENYYKTTNRDNIVLVNSLNEVKKMKLSNSFNYVITSGTSTPNNVVLEIYKYIKSL